MAARSASPARSPTRLSPSRSEELLEVHPPSFEASEPLTRPHTLTVLGLFLVGIAYAVNNATPSVHAEHDPARIREIAKWYTPERLLGLGAALALLIVFSTEHLRDTLLVRPHPAVWRLVNGVALAYAMVLAWMMFQDIDDIYGLLQAVLGADRYSGQRPAASTKSYGDNCELTVENVWSQFDIFVLAHSLGWVGKMLMIRDVWLANALSIGFEMVEYTFPNWQPNFVECWWDHWVMDVLLCNGGGIVVGAAILAYLEARPFNWAGLREIRSLRGRVQRGVLQFMPREITHYRWHTVESLPRFLLVSALVVATLLAELNVFLLKDLFNLEPSNPIVISRLVLMWGLAMIGYREYYEWLSNPDMRRISSSLWTTCAIIGLEFLVWIRFGWNTMLHKPFPDEVRLAYSILVPIALVLGIWWFAYENPRQRAARESAADPASPVRLSAKKDA